MIISRPGTQTCELSLKSPEHHHFTVDVFAAQPRETIIFNISLPSTQAVPSPPMAGLLQPARAFRQRPAPGVTDGQSASQTCPTTKYKLQVSSRIPHFNSCSSPLQSPVFSRSSSSRSGAPHFSLCRGTYIYQNVGRVPPPPLPGPGT